MSSARLSLTPQPVISADAIGVTTLYYTDGTTIITADVSGLAVGAYDVSLTGNALTFSPFNSARNSNANFVGYIGSINVSIAGQLTCHVSADFDRKFEVYNAFNQRRLALSVLTQERDLSYCPVNQYPDFQPFNGNPKNCGTIITGYPEVVEVEYFQSGFLETFNAGAYGLINAIGWNGKTAGPWGFFTHDDGNCAGASTTVAGYVNPAAVGVNVATMLVAAAVNSDLRLSVIQSASMAAPHDLEGAMYIKWFG